MATSVGEQMHADPSSAGASQIVAELGCTLAYPLSTIVGRHLTDGTRDLAVALPS
jgi:hypothetical protein